MVLWLKKTETKKFQPDNLLYWEVIQDKIMLEILSCKFKQCKIAREVLLLTRNAQLFELKKKKKKGEKFEKSILEFIRTKLIEELELD